MVLKIFKDYAKRGNDYPKKAVQYALEHKEEAIPELLEILDNVIIRMEKLSLQKYNEYDEYEDHDEHDEYETGDMIITREFKSFNEENGTKILLMSKETCYILYYIATYLLAYFREKSAYSRVIKIASMKDIVTQRYLDITGVDELSKILASVCDGDIEPIKNIIRDEVIAENIRMDSLESLLILLANDVISRYELVMFLKELLNSKFDCENIYFAEVLCTCSAIIHPQELMDDITKAIEDGRIALSEDILYLLENKYSTSIKESMETFKNGFEFEFITLEIVNDLKYWCHYDEDEEEDYADEDEDEDFDEDEEEDYDEDDEDGEEDYDEDDEEINFDDAHENEDFDATLKKLLQYTKKFDKTNHDEKFDQIFKNETEITAKRSLTGRNDPCPCGSGKKYKKCCINKNITLPIEPAYKELYERNDFDSPDTILTYNKEGYVSGMILDYIDPLLPNKPTINEYKELLTFATATWNISLLPEHLQQIEVAKLVKKNTENKLYDQKTTKTAIKYLIDRKIELFPDIKLKIVDYEVKLVNGKIKVYVASQRLDTF